MIEPVRWSISVRALAEAVWRTGDLAIGGGLGVSARQGAEAHRWYQRNREVPYDAEVPLARAYHADSVTLEVKGRADGVYTDASPPVLEEIKTTAAGLLLLPRDNGVHWAQAKLYGAMYAAAGDHPAVTLRLTYLELRSRQHRSFEQTLTRDALDAFFSETGRRYTAWLDRVASWRIRRRRRLTDLPFPFERYRRGQRALVSEVFEVSEAERGLFVEAPTGSGKTIAVLYGGMKALAAGRCSQVIYLTAKTVGRLAAEAAVHRLREGGASLKSLSMRSREVMCRLPTGRCDPSSCRLAKGHFDRLGGAMAALFDQDAMDGAALDAVAETHAVCPYWLSREMLPWVDVVICDYNYLFDPTARLPAIARPQRERRLCLVDEAHNLVERAREMFSAELNTATLSKLEARLGAEHKPLRGQLLRVKRRMHAAFEGALKQNGRPTADAPPEALLDAVARLCTLVEQMLVEGRGEFVEPLLEVYFEALAFSRAAQRRPDDGRILFLAYGRQLRVKRLSLDPAPRLREILDEAKLSRVFFSATLSPLGYYVRMLGGAEQDKTRVFDSPFPPGRLFSGIAGAISTRFRDRRATAERIGTIILTVVNARRGNYLVFFPSYEYLKLVVSQMTADPRISLVVQTPEQSEDEKRDFLRRFESPGDSGVVGFVVLGGRFGEGIDLVGTRLIGAVVISPGVPRVTLERELLREHFDRQGGRGFDFAYRYPGMNKVRQAAGRVIRSETDRGINLFVCDRFDHRAYRSLLPSVDPPRYARPDILERDLLCFWKKAEKGDEGDG